MGTAVVLLVWALGSVITGLLALLTRGSVVYVGDRGAWQHGHGPASNRGA